MGKLRHLLLILLGVVLADDQPLPIDVQRLEQPDPIPQAGNPVPIYVQPARDAVQNEVAVPVEENYGPKHLFDAPPEAYAEANRVEHLMHDPLGQVNEEGSDDYVDEWTEHMDDFQPDMLVTFRLPSRSEEFFYQEVGPEPTLIRGGYFVAQDKGSTPLRFDVVDPAGEPVLKRLRTESLFHFVTGMPGIYTFTLSNSNWHHDTFVTLVLGAGNETSLRAEQLQNANDNVVAISRMVRDIYAESNYLWGRQKAHMQRITYAGSRTLWLAGLEFSTVIAAVFMQMYLMKSFVSNPRILF